MKALSRKGPFLLLLFTLCLLFSPNALAASTPPYEPKYIKIPADVTVIEEEAFANCVGMTAVLIPEGVKRIEARAFANSGIEALSLPASLESIAEDAFFNTPLVYVLAPAGSYAESWAIENNLPLVRIENPASDFEYSIDNGECTITKYIGTGKDVVIPSKINGYKVTVIGERSFSPEDYENANGITSVVIPDTVRIIEMYAFSYTNLTEVTIPEGVVEMEQGAFAHAYKLKSIHLPSTLKSIGPRNFRCCTGLERFEVPETINCIEREAFSECTGLKEIIIPDSVTEIEWGAFEECTSLTSFTIPNSVSVIEWTTFEGCTGLHSVTIPDSVTSIGGYAFTNCTGLTSIKIPESVTVLDWDTFRGCSSMTSIILPNSLTTIEDSAFEGCTSLKIIRIPGNVTTIGRYAFSDCSSLPSIAIPNSVTSLGDYAFQNCTSLGSIQIPSSLIPLPEHTFAGCPNVMIICDSDVDGRVGKIVAYLTNWDSESGQLFFYNNNLAYFADDTIRAHIPELINQYVYIEYIEKDGVIGYFVNSIVAVTSRVGCGDSVTTAPNADDGLDYLATITIDGVQYQVQPNTILYWSDVYDSGKPMLYHVKQDGNVVGLSLLEQHQGVLREWDPTDNWLKFGLQGDLHYYQLSEFADISFLGSLDEHIGTRVQFYTCSDSEGVLRIDYIENAEEPVFRALIVGNTNYTDKPLEGPENCVHFMQSMLKDLSNQYIVKARLDVPNDATMSNLISTTFADATKNDISLFYYTGHGKEHYSYEKLGALVMLDDSYVTLSDLAKHLSEIPGEVIVILDSCHSGNAIREGNDDFRDFYVLTACTESEEANTWKDNLWDSVGGLLTKGIASGMGCSFKDGTYSDTMLADNGDNNISFDELASYCKRFVDNHDLGEHPQHVQSYSKTPDLVIFRR